jgi:hypothetical protein
MKLTDKVTGEWVDVAIGQVTATDFTNIRQQEGFGFRWELEQEYGVYKLYIKEDENQILGLLSIKDYPKELRIHIRLIEVVKHQIGQAKTLDGIAGCLIAYACALAFKKGFDGFVSLLPKTNLIGLYQDKYGFQLYGRLLAVESERSKQLIDKYIGDD